MKDVSDDWLVKVNVERGLAANLLGARDRSEGRFCRGTTNNIYESMTQISGILHRDGDVSVFLKKGEGNLIDYVAITFD